ncbi:hypothetical protein [Oceanobacillus timonensis]|uniref:hypothetical protein n=1 Tax=Oceanobacillus timonensis TaxID=1926285 RepID=UPI0009B9E56B|nr:hypothetical protein [Oceanobacillus timonensis]
MQVKLLNSNYLKSQSLYEDFVNDRIDENAEYFSDQEKFIEEAPDFPVYMGNKEKKGSKEGLFREAVITLKKYYIQTDREIHLNGLFWHSLLVSKKRDYLIKQYPIILEDQKEFYNIVLKKFDWENYIYKCVLAAEYIENAEIKDQEIDKYIHLIYSNLDMYNYIIKYSIFRNADFVVKLLKIIDEENLSKIMKEKIKHRPDLGKDERYGRRVIFELNKNYPVIMSPFLDKEELKQEVFAALHMYLETDKSGEEQLA